MTTLLANRIQQRCRHLQDGASVVVWGAGQLGQQVQRLLKSDFPRLIFKGFVDRSAPLQQARTGSTIYPIAALPSLRPDYVIVASLAYQPQILAQIAEDYAELGMGILCLAPSAEDIRIDQSLGKEALIARLFDWPDDPTLWSQLAQYSEGELREIFSHCASCLTEHQE